MFKYIILNILLLVSIPVLGQNTDVEFLIEKIKLNYPGYAEKTQGINFDEFVSKTVSEDKQDTFRMMSKIVDFFKDRHLDLTKLKTAVSINKNECNRSFVKIKSFLNSKSKKNEYEGYWINDYNNCVIGLIAENDTKLKGYVIESRDSSLLYPGSQSYEFDLIAPNLFFTKFTSDYSGAQVYIRSSFRNDSIMVAGANGKWRKLKSYKKPILSSLPVFNDTARVVLLDKDNFLITIPISSGLNANIVDSLVKANYSTISKTKNLIIDIRQNMGGTVRVYQPLLPFVYTRPIEKINVELYCTKDGVKIAKENLESYTKGVNIDSSFLKDWYGLIKTEEDSIGKFISGDPEILKFDSVMYYPKNVGIIINYACQSAAEMMLLECMQSDKVTLFGEHSMGAADYLDYYPIDLPSKKYQLKIATTRRVIPSKGAKIDYKGIYPNVSISDSTKNWVDFVKKYYDEKH